MRKTDAKYRNYFLSLTRHKLQEAFSSDRPLLPAILSIIFSPLPASISKDLFLGRHRANAMTKLIQGWGEGEGLRLHAKKKLSRRSARLVKGA